MEDTPVVEEIVSAATKAAIAAERKRAMMYTALETKMKSQSEKWKERALVILW